MAKKAKIVDIQYYVHPSNLWFGWMDGWSHSILVPPPPPIMVFASACFSQTTFSRVPPPPISSQWQFAKMKMLPHFFSILTAYSYSRTTLQRRANAWNAQNVWLTGRFVVCWHSPGCRSFWKPVVSEMSSYALQKYERLLGFSRCLKYSTKMPPVGSMDGAESCIPSSLPL